MRYVTIYGFLLLVLLFSGFTDNNDRELLLKSVMEEYGQVYVQVPFSSKADIVRFSGYFSVSRIGSKSIELCLSPQTIELFLAHNTEYEVLVPYATKSVHTASNLTEAMEWQSYPTFTQYEEIMAMFAEDYPDLCSIDTIGTSIYGKNILVAKISDNVGTDEEEPELFYSSTMHGDELGGFVLMMRLVDHLLKNYGTDPLVDLLIDSLEIYINPLANPDGAYRTGDTIKYPVRFNANGADLNRDFPDIAGISIFDPEKETEGMIRFMENRKFVLSANFHSGAEVVNYPWDRWERRHADDNWFYGISRSYADTAHNYSLSPYMTFLDNGVTNGYDWYYTIGCRQDWVTCFNGGRETTIEIDDTKQTPAENLDSLWIRNKMSLLYYLRNGLFGINGVVTDSTTGLPLGARVFVMEHDMDSSHVYSDTITGIFRRMLSPGQYNLEIYKEGYFVKTVEVDLQQNELLSLDIQLVPDEKDPFEWPYDPLIEELDVKDKLFVFPNPVRSGDLITVYLPERLRSLYRITLFDMAGNMIRDYQLHGGRPDAFITIVTTRMVPGAYLLVATNGDTNEHETIKIIVQY